MKPLHAAERSKPKPPAPSAACTRSAVAGNASSGVAVASRIASICPAAMPAAASALSAALVAMKAQVSCGCARWRLPMPVRSRIHSSEVSIVFDRSSLVTARSGR